MISLALIMEVTGWHRETVRGWELSWTGGHCKIPFELQGNWRVEWGGEKEGR